MIIWRTRYEGLLHDNNIYVELRADADDESELLDVVIVVNAEAEHGELRLQFDYRENNLKIIPPGTDPFVICIVLCLGAFAAGAIVDCFIRYGEDWQKFKSCLEDRGIGIAGEIAKCLTLCSFGAL